MFACIEFYEYSYNSWISTVEKEPLCRLGLSSIEIVQYWKDSYKFQRMQVFGSYQFDA